MQLNKVLFFLEYERPLQCVTAIMNGQIEEKTSASGKEWGPFVFTYSISDTKCLRCSKNCKTYPTFHLRLQFQRPSNARIHHIMNYLRCFPYDESAEDEDVIITFDSSKRSFFPADVQIIVGDEKISAHSAVVAAASPTLAAILESKQYETVQVKDAEKSKLIDHVKVVRVDDVDCDALRNLITYIYTGETEELFENDDSMMKNVFLIAIKFQMEALKQLALQEMKKHIYDENVVDFLVLGHVHSAPALFNQALQHITDIRREIRKTPEWQQLWKQHPELYFDVVRRIVGDRGDGPPVKRRRLY